MKRNLFLALFILGFACSNLPAAHFFIPNHDVATLKAAIAKSNANGCDDTIHLAPGGIYSLTLPDNSDNGLPIILADGAKKLTILGHGALLERSSALATPAFRLLYISEGADVTIDNLTITNGLAFSGAGILNDNARLKIARVSLSKNSAQIGGAIWNNGRFLGASLTVIDSTFSDNSTTRQTSFGTRPRGGAIFNQGSEGNASLTISGSTFFGNSSEQGGAIYSDGGIANLVVSQSTFVGNLAKFNGGAIANISDFGTAALRVTSCTFGHNTANSGRGGAIYNSGENSTAAIEIGNSIFQTGVAGINLFNRIAPIGVFTPIVSLGYNIISDDNDGGFGPDGLLHGPGDQRGTDPLLDPDGLQDNGGPTLTMALLPGSPAIDKGKNIDNTRNDQRGFRRTFDDPAIASATGGDHTDVGAIEVLPDRDGDGVPDYLDCCPDSDLRLTVWVKNFNTGVTNDLLANGCTISDLITFVTRSSRTARQYTAAVNTLTNCLARFGILTAAEKTAIQVAAAKTGSL